MNGLKKIIEKSSEVITKPNNCYNSKFITAFYKKNNDFYEYKEVILSIFYGKTTDLVVWLDNKIIEQFTFSSLKLKINEEGVFENKFLKIKINETRA